MSCGPPPRRRRLRREVSGAGEGAAVVSADLVLAADSTGRRRRGIVIRSASIAAAIAGVVGSFLLSSAVAQGMRAESPGEPTGLDCDAGENIRSTVAEFSAKDFDAEGVSATPEGALARETERLGSDRLRGEFAQQRYARAKTQPDRVTFAGRDDRGRMRTVVVAAQARPGGNWLPVATRACVPGPGVPDGPGPGGDDDE